ncbi:hypothetical protein, partial [Streptomyces sp. NPDC046942]|uniref:hypothetical protein n=1 Tax=Streptomyces sp. NPDC046942 TaxID=3155137 RepID=UPI0033DB9595
MRGSRPNHSSPGDRRHVSTSTLAGIPVQAGQPVATAFLALGLTTTLLGGVARADIPGVNGVYTGCYSRTNG